MVKSELNYGGHSNIHPLRLVRDFSVISFLVTHATKIIQFPNLGSQTAVVTVSPSLYHD
jgi:hypothetical protein